MAPALPKELPPTVGVRDRRDGQEELILPDVLQLLFDHLDAQEKVLKAQTESVEKSRAVLEALSGSAFRPGQTEELPAEEFPPERELTMSETLPADSGPVPIPPHQQGPGKATRLHLFRRAFKVLHFFIPHVTLPRTFDSVLDAHSDVEISSYLEFFCDSRLLYHMLYATITLETLFQIDKPVSVVDVVFFQLLSFAAITNFMSVGSLTFIQTSMKKVHCVNIQPWAAANSQIFKTQTLVDVANTWSIMLGVLWTISCAQLEHLLPPAMLSPADPILKTCLGMITAAFTVIFFSHLLRLVNLASVSTEYSGAMVSVPLPRDDSSVNATALMFNAACVGGLDQGRDTVSKYESHHRAVSSVNSEARSFNRTGSTGTLQKSTQRQELQ